jgi:hypothetical protein
MATGAQHRGELRLRIEGAFSAAQLCELADKWNLERDPRWERSAADAAHGFMKVAERRLGLLELVRRLKLERPLYEWPDLDEAALAEWGPPPSVPATTIAGPGNADTVVAPPPDAAAAPAAPMRNDAPFPGTFTPRTAESKGIDPKVLLVVAGVMLLVVLVAFGAGLAWSKRSERLAASNSASPASSGPAHVASQIFDDALVEVADRCDMSIEGPATKDVLTAAQVLCGGGGGTKRPAKSHEPYIGPDFGPTDANAAAKRTATPAHDAPPPPAAEPRAPAKSNCLTRCASDHSSCVSGCGPEPSDATKYDSWQSCSSRCLTSESRCRLSCH